MTTTAFTTRIINAQDAFDKYVRLATAVLGDRTGNYAFHTTLPGVQISLTQLTAGAFADHADTVRLRERLAACPPGIECTSFGLTDTTRNPDGSFPSLSYSTKEATSALIQTHNFNEPDHHISVASQINKIFPIIQRSQALIEASPAIQRELLDAQNVAAAELRNAVSKLGANLASQQERLDAFTTEIVRKNEERFASREAKLLDDVQRERSALDAARIASEESLRERAEALNEKEKAHQLQVAEHDARQATFVRRDLLSKIQRILEQQKDVGISKATEEKRRVVHALCIVALLAGLGLGIVFSKVVAGDTTPIWSHVTPLSAGILLFSSTLIYYLRWNDNWFRDHAQMEHQNRKLSSDILRASWVAELTFEAKEKDKPLPDLLVSRLSDGLFVDHGLEPTLHPADQLATLLSKVASVKVGPSSVELTKSALKE